MELNYAEVGGRVRDLRRARHLTQEALAEQCNISSPFLGHIERGTRKMSLETLAALAAALEVSADELLFGTCGNRPLARMLDTVTFRDRKQEEHFRAALAALIRGREAK